MAERLTPETQVVASDRRCPGCGYNLRGIPVLGKCPECAMPVRLPANLDAPISEMPLGLVSRFRLGVVLAAVSALAIALVTVLDRFLHEPLASALALTALAIVWAAAIWVLTPGYAVPQAAYHGFAPISRLRVVARLSQPAWVLFGVAHVLEHALPPSAALRSATAVLSLVTGLVGLAGLVATVVVLVRLAGWVRDPSEGLFNGTAFGIVIVAVIVLVNPPVPFVGVFLLLLTLATVVAFLLGLVSLARALRFAALHADDFEDREDRRRQRDERDAFNTAMTVAKMDEARRRRGHTKSQ